jgi:hypothetical protein
MKSIFPCLFASLICVQLASAQGRPVDWSSYGGDAQRTGWAKADIRITKDNVKDFQLVLKRKFEAGKGSQALTPPVVVGNLISYKGFKELAFVAGSDNRVWSVDADLDRMFWQKQIEAPPTPKSNCPAQATAIPALTPPVAFGAARPRPGAGAPPARNPNAPVAFGAPRPVYVIATDGKLHRMNTSDGSDQLPPLEYLPAGSKASALTLSEGFAYTTTSTACGGSNSAVWAIDLSGTDPKPVTFPLTGTTAAGTAGFAIGTEGTVYVQTGAGGEHPNSLLALGSGDLKLKGYFSGSEAKGMTSATPVVFALGGRDLIVTAGVDGRLHLLDSQTLSGDDHKTALSRTEPLTTEHGVWGGLSSWQDSDGVRWVLAPVWGPVNPVFAIPVTNGAAPHGSIMAFKVEEQGGKPALVPAWISGDMVSPQQPVITSGTVFALSSGGKQHATLFALDGLTGKQVYSTGTQVNAPANMTGLSLANGRVFFTTTDNTLYGFGIFLER